MADTAKDRGKMQITAMSFKERLERRAAYAALALPAGIKRVLAGKPIQIDGQTMEPTAQFMVKFFGGPAGHIPTPAEERREFNVKGSWFAHPPEPSVSVSDLTMDGPHGPIPCEMHRPAGAPDKGAPVLLFYHGGGHVTGSLESHRNVCRQLAHAAGCVVIAVGYRLAPEHKFPTGIEDCLASYDYTAANAEALGIDPARISLCGDSAGGNIAAVIAQQRKTAKHPPKFQMLWVPWVDMSRQTKSYELMGSGFMLEKAKMEWYTDHYLRGPDDRENPLASPLLGDVTGVCPAAVLVAGFDPLRDEGIAYAEKLKTAGVSTDLSVNTGLLHMMINVAGRIPAATQVFDRAVEILRNNI